MKQGKEYYGCTSLAMAGIRVRVALSESQYGGFLNRC
jgi:hypothetical protein